MGREPLGLQGVERAIGEQRRHGRHEEDRGAGHGARHVNRVELRATEERIARALDDGALGELEEGLEVGVQGGRTPRPLSAGVRDLPEQQAGEARPLTHVVHPGSDGGQDPMGAIVSATSLAAASLRLEGEVGSLIPGLFADIIATDGNPAEDITALRRVHFVMRAGLVVRNDADGTR